jgi:hypothetical protein
MSEKLVPLALDQYWLGFAYAGPVDRDWFLMQVSLYYESPVVSGYGIESLSGYEDGQSTAYEVWHVLGINWWVRLGWTGHSERRYIIGMQDLDAPLPDWRR